jgi:ATP-binding cassette subfamily G (WHITE) protein 2 (PDR)
MLCGLPAKILVAYFNTALYFMANLRRTPGAFFTFVIFSFFATLTMSSVFRTIAAVCRLAEALAAASFILMFNHLYEFRDPDWVYGALV